LSKVDAEVKNRMKRLQNIRKHATKSSTSW